MPQPFRWDVSKREQLGRLVEGPPTETYPQFIDDLQVCCSRIIAYCANSDLIFIGRSPESIFDYLSGLFSVTSWANRCSLLNISMRNVSPPTIRDRYPGAITAIREQFSFLSLAPTQIIVRDRSVALVDLVASGNTLGNITSLLFEWARELNGDEEALKKKLRFIGITIKKKTSPKTWRWNQQVEWARNIRPRNIKNVTIPLRLWDYLGNTQSKVSRSNPPWRWGDAAMANPPHEGQNLQALRLALYLYEMGSARESRLDFASRLSSESSMTFKWFRALITELRKAA